jgi:peptidoglycan hydrolase CwlO-like protein
MSVPAQSAFVDFRQATQNLSTQSEAQQIHILKLELYCALERAATLQAQKVDLEQEVETLKAEVEQAGRELAFTKATLDRKVQDLEDQARSLQEQGAALERLCQSLLDAVETDPFHFDHDADTLPQMESATT